MTEVQICQSFLVSSSSFLACYYQHENDYHHVWTCYYHQILFWCLQHLAKYRTTVQYISLVVIKLYILVAELHLKACMIIFLTPSVPRFLLNFYCTVHVTKILDFTICGVLVESAGNFPNRIDMVCCTG